MGDDESIDWGEIKSLGKKISEKRFNLRGKYKLDRWLFNLAMFAIFGWLFFVAYSYNFELDYYVCNGGSEFYGGQCENPFYKPSTWKNIEYLPLGEYGQKPGPLFQSVFYVPFLMLLLALVLNHLIHNKGKTFNDVVR